MLQLRVASVGEKNSKMHYHLVIMVDSGCRYFHRRSAIRNSWKLLIDGPGSPISTAERQSILFAFVVGQDASVSAELQQEASQFGDIVQVNVPDSYDTILRKMLEFLKFACSRFTFDYFMHADDDSFVRIDLLLNAMRSLPRQMLYWGYVWVPPLFS